MLTTNFYFRRGSKAGTWTQSQHAHMHTHAGRYASNPQLVICGGPLTPVSGGVGSSQHSDLRGHQRSQCSQGRPRGVGMCPSTWTPPPGTYGGSTNTLPSPGEGWRSWVAPASSSASRTGARTDSDGASFVGGVVVVVQERRKRGKWRQKINTLRALLSLLIS